MGIDNSKSNCKSPPTDQKQILNSADNFLLEHELCQADDQNFKIWRIIIAKLILYGHDNMLSQLKRHQKDKQIRFINQWKSINFETLDLLFQNLIKNKTHSRENVQFQDIHYLDRRGVLNFQEKKNSQAIFKKGQELLMQKKVAVIIFVGSSGSKSEESFNKQFYKEGTQTQCIFEILMERLAAIADQYGLPPTYIFYNSTCYVKIFDFLKDYKYRAQINTCIQNTLPILNLNGHLCLKNKDFGDVIELPNGSGDFYQCFIKNTTILDKLKKEKIEFVSCLDCENMLEKVIDPYMIGLLSQNSEHTDVLYKCTYPINEKQNKLKRVILENNIPKIDDFDNLVNLMKYCRTEKNKNYQSILHSMVWMNSLVFNFQKFNTLLENLKEVNEFPQMFTAQMRPTAYWSSLDEQYHKEQACYVFERQLSDMLINNLFRSQALMVERQDEFLPVLSLNEQYSWKQAYLQYVGKKMEKEQCVAHQVHQNFISYISNINDQL